MTQQGTKIFGFRIPLDPKIFVGILFAIGLLLAWHNFSGGSDDHPSTVARPAVAAATTAAPTAASSLSQNIARRADLAIAPSRACCISSRSTPRMAISIHVKALAAGTVRSVKPLQGGRNLFETGPELAQAGAQLLPKVNRMMPKPVQPIGPMASAGPMAPPPVNIPLRYYGFVKPSWRGDGNRGYFMEGENILMATEGDVLEGQFLVVALSPNKARVEDIHLNRDKTCHSSRKRLHNDPYDVHSPAYQPKGLRSADRLCFRGHDRHHALQRDARRRLRGAAAEEQLAIDRGDEYKRAVKLYVRKFQTFPPSIEALENTNRMRFLRNRYVDLTPVRPIGACCMPVQAASSSIPR